MLAFLIISLASLTFCSCYSRSAQFERWSHFKDHGLPNVSNDPFNQAAIADGTCRMLDPHLPIPGDAFWKSPSSVSSVLSALKSAPDTGKPSYFVSSANEMLLGPCANRTATSRASPSWNFTISEVANGMFNWHRALCAPPSDASWENNEYDPASMPHQKTLTLGYICVMACEYSGGYMGAKGMDELGRGGGELARNEVCDNLPWGEVKFDDVRTEEELSRVVGKIVFKPCDCENVSGF